MIAIGRREKRPVEEKSPAIADIGGPRQRDLSVGKRQVGGRSATRRNLSVT